MSTATSTVDFVMGFGADFGHRPDFVVRAIEQQTAQGFEIGPIHPLAGEAGRLVSELTGMERVAFCNTGSEAVLAALRLARTVTGRDTVAVFSGAYHGVFDEVLVRPATVNGELRSAPIAPGIPATGVCQIRVYDWANPASLQLLRQHAPELAAVVVEPVQSRRLDVQPREFLLFELRQLTADAGVALVFDEVVARSAFTPAAPKPGMASAPTSPRTAKSSAAASPSASSLATRSSWTPSMAALGSSVTPPSPRSE